MSEIREKYAAACPHPRIVIERDELVREAVARCTSCGRTRRGW